MCWLNSTLRRYMGNQDLEPQLGRKLVTVPAERCVFSEGLQDSSVCDRAAVCLGEDSSRRQIGTGREADADWL